MAVEFHGERYRQTSAHQKEWDARLISELSLRGDECILDVGCGDGVLTVQLAELVPTGSVLGIDASSGMIEAAHVHSGTRLSFQVLDVTKADFTGEFDLVFSNATLHWVKDHERLLPILYRALKEEDAIIDAFDSFFRGVQGGRFAQLEDRDDLWQILVMLTDRKVIDQRRREQTQKRGGGHLRGESVFEKPGQGRTPAGGLHCVSDDGPSPEFAEQSAEELRRLLDLLDEQLQQVALLKLQNLTNDEIARQLSVTPRTVERRLSLIRQFWEGEIGGGERL